MTALAEPDVPFLPLRAAKASPVLPTPLHGIKSKLLTARAPDCEYVNIHGAMSPIDVGQKFEGFQKSNVYAATQYASNGTFLGFETHRIQIGVDHPETKAHRLTGEFLHPVLPGP